MADTAATNRIRWLFPFAPWVPVREPLFDALLALLQPEERARILRFRRPQKSNSGDNSGTTEWLVGRRNPDAVSALAGRLMLRRACELAMALPFAAVELGRTEAGKPFLRSEPKFAVNLSHAGDLVALGALLPPASGGSALLLGVDVMPLAVPLAKCSGGGSAAVDETLRFLSDMRSCFSELEWHQIDSNCDSAADCDRRCAAALRPLGERVAYFFRFWVLKEAYIKAIGVGLQLELNRMEFTLVKSDGQDAAGKPAAQQRPVLACLHLDGRPMDDRWVFAYHHIPATAKSAVHAVGVAVGCESDDSPISPSLLALATEEALAPWGAVTLHKFLPAGDCIGACCEE